MLLQKRYARSGNCTQGQVSATLRAMKAKESLWPYSYAVFLSDDEALEHFKGAEGYEQIVKEVADLLYQGDVAAVGEFRKAIQVGNSGHSSFGVEDEYIGTHDQPF